MIETNYAQSIKTSNMKTLRSILVISIIILSAGNLIAQKDYQSLTSNEGIDISYKWKHSKILKKESPLMLFLKLQNSNEYHANVNFTVDYYWQGIRSASSEPNSICIKSNRTAKGRIKKLTFDRAKLSDEDVLSDDFTLDISEIDIERVDQCKRK